MTANDHGMRCLQRLRWPCLLIALLGAGCQRSATPSNAPHEEPAQAQVSRGDLHRVESPPHERWFVHHLQGEPLGYQVLRHTTNAESAAVHWWSSSRLRIRRFGDTIEQVFEAHSWEHPDGRVQRCEWTLSSASDRRVCRVVVQGETATVEFQAATDAVPAEQHLAWPADTRGCFAVEQSLADQPLLPGESRTFQAFVPLFNCIATFRMRAEEAGPSARTGADAPAVPDSLAAPCATVVQVAAEMPAGQPPWEYQLWVDAEGEILQQEMTSTGQTMIRVERDVALAAVDAATGDFGLQTLIPLRDLNRQPDPLSPRCYVFTMSGEKADSGSATAGNTLVDLFAQSPLQDVETLDPQRVRVSVRPPDAVPLATVGHSAHRETLDLAAATDDLTAADRARYLASGSLTPLDNPGIVELAASVGGEDTQPLTLALALESRVAHWISRKDYTRAFASAADVAQSRRGDCTEHAVLLAALCRARGIPARGVIGLVVLPGGQSLAFHMWCEIWATRRWHPLDATAARGGINSDYIKLADTTFDEQQIWGDMFKVLRLMHGVTASVEPITARQ